LFKKIPDPAYQSTSTQTFLTSSPNLRMSKKEGMDSQARWCY